MKYLTLIGTYLKKVEVSDLQKIRDTIVNKLIVFLKIKDHITRKHLYVSGIVFFQLLSLFCLFFNIYYVVTFVILYTTCSIALFVHLYKEAIHKNENNNLNSEM
ncbi:hypothetical protein CIB95_06970 [Lottiidibacillus patelloidae]|uniref:Uncharacterized protein n=2 Tax=Lottiidibacillus patelloidae TaxID=2670334 RepID=A0A263BTX8_9BACI|nr:hypothetical protein CIB95_06970 [Lottiidibacillus patelloidae]